MAPAWLFLDMNAFFASVEQQENPKLRGRPVAVVPVLSDQTCCIAVSYEARAFGIKTGTNVGTARRLCPHLAVIEARHRPYQQYSQAIHEVVDSYIPVTNQPYVDEMYCRLWDNEKTVQDAVRLGQQIKAGIHRQIGAYLHCSVGLSVTPFLSKIAAELQKPNGLVVLAQNDVPERLFGMSLTDFPGISRRMETRFASVNVFNTEQMYALTEPQMRSVWGGVMGIRWWRQLRGLPLTDIPTVRRCISHSHVLSPELRTPEGAFAVTVRLLEKAAMRMRALGYHARSLSAYLRSVDGETWERRVRFAPCQDPWTLIHALQLFWEHPFPCSKQAGVVLSDVLPEGSVTLSLFDDQATRIKAAQMVDQVNRRFGRGTLLLAGGLRAVSAAGDKIAFGKFND